MKIDLFGTIDENDHISVECDPHEIDIAFDDVYTRVDGPIKVDCHLHRSGELVYVEGKVKAVLEMDCSRCVEPFLHDFEEKFSFVVRRLKIGETVPDGSDEGEELDEENLIYLPHDENSMDITELVRDAAILSVPLKPVCSESCKGLCPVCGHNLNTGDCGCSEKRTDPRWQSLSGLFDKNSKK